MDNKESIKSKIKKLLALSADNPSDEESFSAFQKAQELMARYKLEQKDIMTEEKIQKCIQKKTSLFYGSRSSDHYLSDLASIIADNFCCVDYISRVRGTQTNRIVLMGLEEDVAIAEEALNHANEMIRKGYDRVYYKKCKEYGCNYLPAKYFNPLKLGYIEGYLAGLKKAFEDQKEKNQEWGLVLVAPQEAQEFVANLGARFFNAPAINYDCYNEGYNDGKNFKMMKKLDDAKTMDKITN